MKKTILFSFLLVATFLFTLGQTSGESFVVSSMAKTIRVQAQEMCRFLFEKNYPAFVKCTYPKIVDMLGGESEMINTIEESYQKLAEQGMEIQKVTIGEPSKVITAGKELQCTVPQTLEMKMPGGILVANSTLIGISTDQGKKWYFLDTSRKDLKTLQQQLPNLSNDLVIPPKEQPVFHQL